MIYKLSIDVFVLTDGFQAAVEGARGDHLLSRSRIDILPGGLEVAVEHYADKPTPDVIVVESGPDQDLLFECLAGLADVCQATTKVIVAAPINNIACYRTLISQGISDYLVLPLTARQIVESLDGIYAEPSSAPRGKVIAFFGARGGAGSSTVAHNTAWALTKVYGSDVALLDLDLVFGTLGMAFNLSVTQTVTDALNQPDRLDSTLLEKLMIKHDDHLMLLPSSSSPRFGATIHFQALEQVLNIIRLMVPYVILDLPRLWEPWVEDTLGLADEVVITTLPDLAGLRDAKALFDYMIQKKGAEAPVHLVLNRCGAFSKDELSGKDFSETLGRMPVVSLNYDAGLYPGAFNNAQMVGDHPKGGKAAEGFRQLAAKVSGRPPPGGQKKKSPFSDWLENLTKKAKK
ncbi:MAG: pilus assembly protein CpaF [Alphaproteobacteria bacterium]|nr:pilus assembly protein CpaF [Alphaproteobacteria bacterium]MBF0129749.1 pilus assembly protein CpaF [Alphaproteobacteria bacterium]